MADDEDAIYIDVIPRVDDSAADSAVEKLKDKFKDVAGDIGPEFMDAMNNSGVLEDLGAKLGEALAGPLKDLSDGTGIDLKNPLEKMLKQDMGGALDDVANQLGEKLGKAIKDPLRDAASSIGVDLDDAVSKALNKDWGGLGTSLGKGVGGKIGQALGLEDTLSGLDGILGKAQDIGDVVNNFRSGNLAGGLQGAGALFGGSAGPVQGPLGDVSTFFGNVSALGDATGSAGLSKAGTLLSGGSTLLNNFVAPDAPDRSLSDSLGEILTHAGIGAGFGAAIPGLDATGIPEILGALVGGGGSLLHNWDSISHNLFGGAPAPVAPRDPSEHAQYAAMFGNAPLSFDAAAGSNAGTSSLYSGDTGSPFLGGGGGTTTANEVDVQASAASVTAGSVTLGGNISIPGMGAAASSSAGGGGRTTSTGVAAAGGDSGSMASLYSGGSGTTIGKGHYASGGVLPGGSPGYDNMIGTLPGGGMVGLEGGEGVIRPEAMGRPGVADLVSSLNQHYDEGTASAAGVGGDSNNPSLSTPPTQGNQAGNTAGGNAPKQQQQLGKGQGGGVSGGGLIGAAEQAGVAAAGIAGFGGGAIVAQMAVQETNLAVQKASQNIAALATAPFETFGLGGGMMGAPTVNPMGGWIGKLISGELGSQTSLPNLAGASTQPPKKPDQKPEDQPEGQGQGESVSKGPAGSKDDPMHVNVTNQAQAPQGSATSAMNVSPALAMAP